MSIEVRAAGYPLSSVCLWRGLSWLTRWPYGDWECTWKISQPTGWRHPALVTDALVEVMNGGKPWWVGSLTEPGWGSGEMYARGLVRRAEWEYAFQIVHVPDGGDGYDAAVPATNVTEALAYVGGSGAAPLLWKYAEGDVPDTDYATAELSADMRSWFDLLDLATTSGDGTPVVFAGRLSFLPDPTTPKWHVHPSHVDIGEAGGDSRATKVILSFINADEADAEWWVETAEAPLVPKITVWEDARSLGSMTASAAATLAADLLAQQISPVFVDDVVLTPFTATAAHGQPCDPLAVRAGDMVRVHGVSRPGFPANYIDFIAGEVAVADAETSAPTATVKPFGKPSRTVEEMFEAAERLRKARDGQ